MTDLFDGGALMTCVSTFGKLRHPGGFLGCAILFSSTLMFGSAITDLRAGSVNFLLVEKLLSANSIVESDRKMRRGQVL